MIQAIFFYVFAASAVFLALAVVSARNPVYSAMALIGCLLSVASIFALQSAHLLALLQVLVYAGAIMFLILFVIMLLNLSPRELGERRVTVRRVTGAYLIGAVATILMIRVAKHHWASSPADLGTSFGTVKEVGTVLYTRYLLPFEMVSLLLLAAIIGAVVLTRKEEGDGQ
ncbi:MAG: NADH-quinone oxidoreductase subunit J family protein [Thermodesulfobacteriota bacterium]